MSIIILLILASGLVAAGFLLGFLWAVKTGQFDDDVTPAMRILLEDRIQTNEVQNSESYEPKD